MEAHFIENFTNIIPLLALGIKFTLSVTIIGVTIGIMIGLCMALMKLSNSTIAKTAANFYIEVLRGTPLFVQIFLFHYGGASLVMGITGEKFHFQIFTTACIVCGLNSGAYVAEIFRAGIQGVDSGQIEAARSLGMNKVQTMRYIVVPQAFKLVIPPLGNEFVMLLKDTSLLSAIGAMDIMKRGQIYISFHASPFAGYLAIALMYLVLTFSLTRVINWYENKLSSGGKKARSIADIR